MPDGYYAVNEFETQAFRLIYACTPTGKVIPPSWTRSPKEATAQSATRRSEELAAREILKNEKCIGNYVFNRSRQRAKPGPGTTMHPTDLREYALEQKRRVGIRTIMSGFRFFYFGNARSGWFFAQPSGETALQCPKFSSPISATIHQKSPIRSGFSARSCVGDSADPRICGITVIQQPIRKALCEANKKCS